MQPPRRVSVDVSAAARFALLYFFLPLEASAHTYLQRLPACALGGYGYLPPTHPAIRRPRRKKSAYHHRRSSQLSACPGTATRRGFFFPLEQPARARGLFTAAVQKPGAVPYSYTPTTRRVAYEYIFLRFLCVYAVRWS
jgi:hypothetical protein